MSGAAFDPPQTVAEAEGRQAVAVTAILEIDLQLAQRRLAFNEGQIETDWYKKWRVRAIAVKTRQIVELRQLKNWVKNVQLQGRKEDPVLDALHRAVGLLHKMKNRHAVFSPEELAELDAITTFVNHGGGG